ncbi:MAG: T9SS type A sorting domain-containing protein [Bacteroidetes bacterium]|nr:T9SS type A sorting domain-containing protein [Bacteroidota bacterium]
MKCKLFFSVFFLCFSSISNSYSQLTIDTVTSQPTCAGGCTGSAGVSVSGGSPPYTYLWNDPQWHTTATVSNLCAGGYIVTVTDNASTTVTANTTIGTYNVVATASSTPTSCSSCMDGSAVASGSQGYLPYTFQWSNGATNGAIDSLPSGYYCVTVTDSHGCSDPACTYVDSSNCGMTVTVSVTDPSCDTCCDGIVTPTVSGGTPPYLYIWSTGDTQTNANGLCGGLYWLTVCDNSMCCVTTQADVGSDAGCTSWFYYYHQTPCTYQFYDYSPGTITGWHWSFGDGTADSIQNPGHTYSTSGFYMACLTVTTSDSCEQTSCQYVYVSGCYPGGSNCIFGCVYDDVNDNCIMDPGEDKQSSWLVQLFDTNNILIQTTKSYNAGCYSFYNIPDGDYVVRIDPITYWWQWDTECPVPDFYEIMVDSGGCDTLHFAVGTPATSIGQDLAIASDPIGQANPGGSMNFRSGIMNKGSATMDGSLYFIPDQNFTNLNYSNPYPDAIDGDTLKWDFTGLAPGDIFQPYFSLGISPSVTMGQFLGFKAFAYPLQGDVTPINNVDTGYIVISAPYDPNNKLVSPMGYSPDGAISDQQPDLTYTINFQNTGNDTAINIYILDTIDLATLNFSSLQILYSSHDYNANFLGANVILFEFPDIMLPDSNVNEPGSHGFIKFSIGLVSDLEDGTEIKNNAAIYFDYNAPVITDWAINTIDKTMEVSKGNVFTQRNDYMNIWPNPVKQGETVFIFLSDEGGYIEMIVYDIAGKPVMPIPVQTGNKITQFSSAGLDRGVYFAKITDGKSHSYITKLVIF